MTPRKPEEMVGWRRRYLWLFQAECKFPEFCVDASYKCGKKSTDLALMWSTLMLWYELHAGNTARSHHVDV